MPGFRFNGSSLSINLSTKDMTSFTSSINADFNLYLPFILILIFMVLLISVLIAFLI